MSHPSTPLRSGTGRSGNPSLGRTKSGAVARATEDTTLAVIPAEAFKRLTKKFPKASAHIVQGNTYYSLRSLRVHVSESTDSNSHTFCTSNLQCCS